MTILKYLQRSHLVLLALILAATALASPAALAATVGDPKNAAALAGQISDAYQRGEKTITIAPGKYLLGGGDQSASLFFEDLKNVTIEATGVELSFSDDKDALGFNRCENVTLRGATVHYERPRFSQARILSFGTDAAKGPYYEVQIDAGYPLDADCKSSYVFEVQARRIKFRTGDMGAKSVEKLDGAGRARIFWPRDDVMPPKYNVAVGDYLVCRGGGSSLLHVDASKSCIFENLRFYWGGVFGIFETGRSESNTFRNISITPGPRPPGATNAPLISQSADGLHSAASRVGPTIQNCTFEAMCDDAIAIHGYFVDILAVDGAKLTTKALWGGPGFVAGDTARVSSDKGFLEEARVVVVEKQADGNFVLTLDRALDAKAGYKAGNPSASGAGYRIIGNTIRNNRARGILVKGDNGLIENNTIDGSTMSGISIGPEYYWNEADYPRNITVRGNLIRNTNYATNNFGRNGGILIHGDGTRGNRDITIDNNRFDGIFGPNLVIEWAQGVRVRRNAFENTHARSVGEDDVSRSLVWLRNSRDVEFVGNAINGAGAELKDVVLQGEGVGDVRGADDGFARGPQVLAGAAQAAFSYSNPLGFGYVNSVGRADEREVRDPCIIREGDTYYMVFTMWPFANREEKRLSLPDNGSSPGIQLYASKDLKTWQPEKWLIKSSELPQNSPYKHRFWAPEIHKFNGKFYLIFTADNWLKPEWNPAGNWGAAGYAFVGVADKITGPYEHITYIPQGACDTTLTQDDKGQIYAVMPKSDIFIRPIDLSQLPQGKVAWQGEEKLIVRRQSDDTELTVDPNYLEGPWVEKVGGKYLLFYAEFFRDEAAPDRAEYWTGVAYADSILGPWTKDRRGKVFEGGHVAIFDGPASRKWISYRIEQKANRGLLAIDPFSVDAQGKVRVQPPTLGEQSVPEAAAPRPPVAWTPIAPPKPPAAAKRAQVLAAAARDFNASAGLPTRVLFDNPVRDPHILHAPDGWFYMVATASRDTLPASIPSRPDSDFWTFNDGIPLWRSKDLISWETAGYVWQFERDATWQRALKPSPHTGDGKPVRAIWAPEIHYMKGTFWMTYSMNYDGTGILKSTSGRPEGPYVDVKPSGPLAEAIDATIFEDSDRSVYYLDFGYRVARMKPDMSDLAEPIRELQFEPAPPWGEGVNMKKVGGKYLWTGAGRESGSYDAYSATSNSIYGPYRNRYRAIPYAGHNDLFQDKAGRWWSTLFHPSDYLNLGFRPAIVPVTMSRDALISPTRAASRPQWKFSTAALTGNWTALGFDDHAWKSGAAGFGNPKIEEAGPITDVATEWKNGDLWLRRRFTASRDVPDPLLFGRHSGPVEIWLNGVGVYKSKDARSDYRSQMLEGATVRRGENILAVHARAGEALPYFDMGLAEAIERLLLPTAKENVANWRYSLSAPTPNWMQPTFDDSAWAIAPGGFGNVPEGAGHTPWSTSDIWLRREFTLKEGALKGAPWQNPRLRIAYDEDAEVYINGILAARLPGFSTKYLEVPMSPASGAALKPGRNVIAVHCRQTSGAQFIDVGIVGAAEPATK